MGEKQYLILLDVDVRKRHYHVTEAGHIVKFSVQLEVYVGNAWKEVLRYDCSHDFVHKDCYNIQGSKRKIAMHLDYEEALTFADEDLDENWAVYRERFLRGDFP